MTNVYNTVSEVSHKDAKLSVLKHLIRFAADARQLELLQPYLAGAAGWTSKWGLTAEQAGALYLLIAQCLEKGGAAEEAQAFLIRYLTTLEGASDAAKAGARTWAKTAALNFVKAPAVSQKSNLARLAAVRARASRTSWERFARGRGPRCRGCAQLLAGATLRSPLPWGDAARAEMAPAARLSGRTPLNNLLAEATRRHPEAPLLG